MASSCDAAVRVAAAKDTAGRDRALVLDLGGRFVVAVARGFDEGGDGTGAEAADAVIAAVQAAAHRAKFDPTHPTSWSALLTDVDDDVWRVDHGGEASAVALFTDGDHVVGASVGDCGASITARGSWMELTRRQHPAPRLGTGGAEPVAFEVRLKAPSLALVVATSALWQHAPRATLDAALRTGGAVEATADALAAAMRHDGDAALALVRFSR